MASLVLAVGGNGAAANPSLHPMINSVDPDSGLPVIFTACLRGSASAVEQLCYAGANVQHADDCGRNLFHYLAQCMPKCHPHTVLVVAAASCGLPSRYQPGTKCVVVRAAHGHELFIPKGLILRACCKKISFFWISYCCIPEHLRRQIYACDHQGDTPLHTAVQQLRPCGVASFLLLGMCSSTFACNCDSLKYVLHSVSKNSHRPKQTWNECAARTGAAIESTYFAVEPKAILRCY